MTKIMLPHPSIPVRMWRMRVILIMGLRLKKGII